jgi:hypothetical protein
VAPSGGFEGFMKRIRAAVSVTLLSAFCFPSQVLADAPSPAPVDVCGGSADGCGGDGAFVAGSHGQTPGAAGTPAPAGHGGHPTGTYAVYDYAPTCSGNTRGTADVCGAALNSCQPPGKGYVRYWVWTAEVDRATGKVVDPPGWVEQSETVCFGPAQQGIPARAAIGGLLASEFQKLVVRKGVAHVDPRATTLVNFENGFWTEARTYVLPPVQILGHRVVVTATPERYDWHFGDGTVALDAGPGRSGETDVAHTYTRSGVVKPYVVITWSGTFTVDGGSPLDVIGTATTTGDGTPLQVKEAHAQLVS